MRFVGIILLLGVLISCGQPEVEVVDLNEILPQSERTYNDTVNDTSDDSVKVAVRFFEEYGMKVQDLKYSVKQLFPDRFRPERALKYEFEIDTNRILYCRWAFEDSVKVMSAFYNWLDQKGIDQVGSKQNFQKEAMYMMVGDTSLIYVSGPQLDFNAWLHFHESQGFESDWNYVIEQRKRGRARWFVFEEGKKEQL